MSLNWLAVLLSEKGLDRPGVHFKNYKMVKKINNAVLPVFFKQADTCLVHRKGFDIMAELNPQIARQMRIVATSPPYIPVILCFRKTYQSPVKQLLLRDLQKIVESLSGAQLLTIFQIDGMQQISKEELADSISLLEKDHILSGLPESGKAKGADN
ncbi:PhnD/SsuA/transferrin family substrate-binding protein [Desulfobacter curvatus]|uniref:PhnD/SsuA/transferrin family substrate-binding protein n=1 Tax=Desulfobacter curvatus TaxID=2290 RepID=UPI000367A609|nr:PhnD/SsuA/transferrin family substrate-binding protein [Desulfobacter curvatus]